VTSLQIGALVRVRQRFWLVEDIQARRDDDESDLVTLACIDDDAQGQPLTVLWQAELDAKVFDENPWERVGQRGFDDSALFAAYLHTRRWNSVTATDERLLQAPFRAGIRIDAYQLEPLRKALALPRVNLFIADDVGLGKTIEAGLIARELLLRRKINSIVVVAPPSMLLQWQDELEARFGLSFVIMDRDYFAAMRRERGYSVNPWRTHSYFLLSNRRLIDATYSTGLRDWLGELRSQSLLILDEAHHAAPASGSRYAIDSKITREVRDLAKRFEHRVFLSATPHNGHSNSFSALLEILDPNRFFRGMDLEKGDLREIMVRRIKDDIRELEGGFPIRKPEQIDIDGLPPEAPELILSAKFDAYRAMREGQLSTETRSAQSAGHLVLVSLQKRLLSSVEAFSRTIRVHRDAVRRAAAKGAVSLAPAVLEMFPAPVGSNDEPAIADVDISRTIRVHRDAVLRAAAKGVVPSAPADVEMLLAPVGSDDERATADADAVEKQADDALSVATEASIGEHARSLGFQSMLATLDELVGLADQHRDADDARVVHLIHWIDAHQCPGVLRRLDGARWNRRRTIIFTEWEDTRRYLERRLRAAIALTDRADERIAVYSGATTQERREELKHDFNTDPDDNPIRILIATDSAREGLNLQRHCYDLFHFDLPWNPSRIEQRNGRIDRKLQPNQEVYCRYFYYHQRPEDAVLRALVKKTETIRHDLGALSDVLESRTAELVSKRGIARETAIAQALAIDGITSDDKARTAQGDLEDDPERDRRRTRVRREIDELRTILERSERVAGVDAGRLRQAIDVGLMRECGKRLTTAEAQDAEHPELFTVPTDTKELGSDPRWLTAIDMLRTRRSEGEDVRRWRREAKIRPVTFSEPGAIGERAVQLHLEHRFVKRVLSRFVTRGMLEHDLSRACLTIAPDAVPRVILIGRLSIYGPGGSRLHEELVEVTARWVDPGDRSAKGLQVYGRTAEQKTLDLLEQSLVGPKVHVPDPILARLQASIGRDVLELTPALEDRCDLALGEALKKLQKRATSESLSMVTLLEEQDRRIRETQKKWDSPQLALGFSDDEERQLALNRRYWSERLEKLASVMIEEPKRILEAYDVKATRIEPVGIAYLWPASG
jgi:Helicase conserved C-terminal domain/SNF2-related domain